MHGALKHIREVHPQGLHAPKGFTETMGCSHDMWDPTDLGSWCCQDRVFRLVCMYEVYVRLLELANQLKENLGIPPFSLWKHRDWDTKAGDLFFQPPLI